MVKKNSKAKENKSLAIRMLLGDPSAAIKLLTRAAFKNVDPEGETELFKSIDKLGNVIATTTSIGINPTPSNITKNIATSLIDSSDNRAKEMG